MSFWDETRVEKLKKLWSEGLSASQIAGRFGEECTRNMIISKVHRLRLAPRATTTRSKALAGRNAAAKQRARARAERAKVQAGAPKRASAVVFEVDPFKPVVELKPTPAVERKSLLKLENSDCRYPYGGENGEPWSFCARPKVTGLPYCEAHVKLCYAPPAPKKAKGGDLRVVAGDGGQRSETPASGQNSKDLEEV